MLGQQFNYEYEVLFSAWRGECKHIVKLLDFALSIDSVIFEQKRYDMDLRTYLASKNRDYRKLNDILL